MPSASKVLEGKTASGAGGDLGEMAQGLQAAQRVGGKQRGSLGAAI
jgi:hypothetical protein